MSTGQDKPPPHEKLLQNSLQLDGSYDVAQDEDNILLNNALEWFDGYTTSNPPVTTTNLLDYDVANIDMDNFNLNDIRVVDFDEEPSQRHGETIASMTGSILDQMDASVGIDGEGSVSNSSLDLSICKSLALFSPMDQPAAPLTQFSTDSLDVSGLLATCMTNRNNYTIAFEQSSTDSTDSSRKLYDLSRTNSSHGNSKQTPTLRSIEIQTSCESGDLRPTNVGENNGQHLKKYVYCNLPDLGFLKQPVAVETGQNQQTRKPRPLSCNDIEELRQRDFSHVKDWPSLNFLLPAEYQRVLGEKEDGSEKVELRRRGVGGGARVRGGVKRFSLPVTIPEVGNLTEEIERNLYRFEEWSQGARGESGTDSREGSRDSRYGGRDTRDDGEKSSYYGSNHRNNSGNQPKSNRQSYDSSNATSNRTSYEQSRIAHVTPMLGSRVSRVSVDLQEKQAMTDEIISAIDRLIKSSSKPIIFSQSTAGRLVLEVLCPALYNLLSDGLSPHLETIFGRVTNTVWRVVEASIQCGPTAQTLNELVMKINSEDSLAEGPIKFNAFICGLLNLSALQSWLTFLRTKERLLRTHYSAESFMFLCNTSTRLQFDSMVTKSSCLKIHFELDIFHQARILHQTMSKTRAPLATTGLKKQTKTSKYHANLVVKKTQTQMKRSFSDERPKVNAKQQQIPKSKTAQNIKKFEKEEKGMGECQPQTLENNFKQLQLQWELLASDERVRKFQSKIPRPITSPVKGQQQGIGKRF